MSFVEKLNLKENFSKKKKPGEYSMTQWGDKLKTSSGGRIDFHEGLAASREGKRRLVELNLPRYKKIVVSVGEFLADPQKTIALLNNSGELFFPEILKPNGQRVYELGLNENELIAFIKKQVTDSFGATEEDELVLSEFFKNIYGGNLIIERDGDIFLELCEGNNSNIAHGHKIPILIASKEQFTGSMRYEKRDKKYKGSLALLRKIRDYFFNSWSDEEFEKVKLSIAEMLANFPTRELDQSNVFSRYTSFTSRAPDDDTRKEVLVPGYFEFFLTKLRGSEKYEVIFNDSREVDNYSLAPLKSH